jgi:L-serine dehydratase
LARELMGGDLRSVVVQLDPQGSLATTHSTQGSDMGLAAGLLGWDARDERLPRSERQLRDDGIAICYELVALDLPHPNTYRLLLRGRATQHTLAAISTGGGMIELIAIDRVSLTVRGDYDETLVWIYSSQPPDALVDHLPEADRVLVHGQPGHWLIQVQSQQPLAEERVRDLVGPEAEVRRLAPVLPIRSRPGMTAPFTTCQGLAEAVDLASTTLGELALRYEATRGNLAEPQVLDMAEELITLLSEAVEEGLRGTQYPDRILGPQAARLAAMAQLGQLLGGALLNRTIAYVTALMEVKSAMGLIVAAPTAGSCGALPGALLATGEELGRSRQQMATALLAGGLIGVFIAARSTFAAEVCGCQVECGAASGMAAAALVDLAGGNAAQAVAAASLALQNVLGLICDPVANRVEVPCLGRNVMAASNALACANMALAGYDPVIPLDQVIATMDTVGKSLPRELRCTALGGLSITAASRQLEHHLAEADRPVSS